MNIITRKKEIMEVIGKLNEATVLATKALNDLSEYVENTQPMEAPTLFNADSIAVDCEVYVKTDNAPKIGDYIVFDKEVPNRTRIDIPYLYTDLDKIKVSDEGELWLNHWVNMYGLKYAVFTKKPRTLTRKDVINKAVDYIDEYLYKYVAFDTYDCKMYITHNNEDRTSTIVLKGKFSGIIRHKETIRCHPDDVYNNAIGAAILIARVKGDKEMVELFENAPQPTEIKSGMVIDIMGVTGDNVWEGDFKVHHYDISADMVRGDDTMGNKDRHIAHIKRDGFKIKDDSDVIY